MTHLRHLSGWALVGVLLALTLPIAAAVLLAERQGVQREERYLNRLAHSALRISEGTGDQLAAGARIVNAMSPAEACSETGLDRMRRIDLASTLLQAVGRIEGDVMRCSSFSDSRSIALGPPSFRSRTNAVFWTDVRLLGSDIPYLVIASGAFVGVVHKDLPLSFVEQVPGLTTGVFSWSTGRTLLGRGGALDPAWKDPHAAGDHVFRSGGRTVAVVRSKRYDTGAVAALPLSHAAGFVREAAMLWVPIGALIGVLLAAALIYLVRTRASMPAMIRQALRAGELFLVYQPVIDLSTGLTVGVEALLRWRRPNGELVPPDVFIPAAEQSGLIKQVTVRVLDLLAEDARSVLRLAPDFHFAVNFSAADMHREDIVDVVGRFIATAGLLPRNLMVEATERSLVDVELARRTMRALRAKGVKVAIDDFGTGYSSLGYLAQLEMDFLKIDKLFVQALGTESATSHVAARIIDMSKDLKLQIIAEGVETPEQQRLLRLMGVEFVQGYLYERPMGIEPLLQRLRAEKVTPVRPQKARQGGRPAKRPSRVAEQA